MELFDTHVHLNSHLYEGEVEEIIQRAIDSDVKFMAVIGFDEPSNLKAIQLAETYDAVYAVVGIHPSDAKTATASSWPLLRQQLTHPKVVALGEIGLDFYHDTSFNDIQYEVFKTQLAIAKEMDKPIVIHMRESIEETYEVLAQYGQGLTGVAHCFSGTPEQMERFLALGLFIGLDGPVTFKNAKSVHELAKAVPLERLVLETDGPYLTPTPYRGKRNEPAYLNYIAEKIAELKGTTKENIAQWTTANGKKLYRIND